MKLKIRVTTYWMHPEYGGNRIEDKNFEMSEAIQAEIYFKKCIEDDKKNNGFSHTSIFIVGSY